MKKESIIQSRLINDTIYNHIEYTKLEDKILKTKILNRLQFITQNALAYFSYPSITTKRYIHSLGTMHLSSFIFKNALLNANKDVQVSFIKDLKKVFKVIIKDNKLNVNFDNISYFDNKALYQFIIPTNNKKDRVVYTIMLQTIRIVALLHDVGHLPFSHQVEYALQRIYDKISIKKNLTLKEKEFKKIYDTLTLNNEEVLHEAIGRELLILLLEHELYDSIENVEDKEILKLIKILALLVIENKKYKGFDFAVLHRIVDSTVDADRLDYINRDMLSSGYITGANDHIRITKQAIMTKNENRYYLSYFDMGLIDIEHMLEMRFNLYKKVIFNHEIAKKDVLLENVVQYLSEKYFNNEKDEPYLPDSISMLWKFQQNKDVQRVLDIISLLDENWLILLFKKEYFSLKEKKTLQQNEQKYLYSLEEVLFGKLFFKSLWKNLNEFYNILEFTDIQRYKFRESFGYITPNKAKKLQDKLDKTIDIWEKNSNNSFFTHQIVSFKIGIEKDFQLSDGNTLISIDQISTLRKRLKHSMLNTVPFYIYANNKTLSNEMKEDLKSIIFSVFKH